MVEDCVFFQYMFMFQLPWLPEFTLGLNDFKMFDDMFGMFVSFYAVHYTI